MNIYIHIYIYINLKYIHVCIHMYVYNIHRKIQLILPPYTSPPEYMSPQIDKPINVPNINPSSLYTPPPLR